MQASAVGRLVGLPLTKSYAKLGFKVSGVLAGNMFCVSDDRTYVTWTRKQQSCADPGWRLSEKVAHRVVTVCSIRLRFARARDSPHLH